MSTEEQRRALFALREALRLCEDAKIYVVPFDDYDGYVCAIELHDNYQFGTLSVSTVEDILQRNPE